MRERFPLSSQQQWLWNLIQKNPDWKCVVSQAFCLRGVLDTQALRRSIDEVRRRHAILRASFGIVDGAVNQQIDDLQETFLDPVRIRGSSAAQIEANARALFEEASDLAMDVYRGPLLRFGLLELAEHEHWLVMAMHRLLGDCSAIDQIFREIWLHYAGALRNRTPALAADPAQYGDYAIWQERNREAWYQKHDGYWQLRLCGASALCWPLDAHPEQTTKSLGRMNTHFGPELSADLRELGRKGHSLSANVMLAIYIVVLWRWCKQRDFVIPVKIAGRHAEHRSIVGYFTQILYLRIELSGDETFGGLLNQVSGEFYRGLSHQDFGRVATEKPELLAGTFFQWITLSHSKTAGRVMGAEQDFEAPEVQRLPLSDFGEDHTAVPTGMVDVEVTFFDTEEGIYASGVYRADRFSDRTMVRFMRNLRSATEELIGDPQAKISRADFP